jgi:hypothetical protein
MNCPPEIADCVLEIIQTGALNIRTAASRNDAHRCFVEADHIHNLPQVLKSYAPELLTFYLTVERPSFIQQVPEANTRTFESAWKRLDLLAKT